VCFGVGGYMVREGECMCVCLFVHSVNSVACPSNKYTTKQAWVGSVFSEQGADCSDWFVARLPCTPAVHAAWETQLMHRHEEFSFRSCTAGETHLMVRHEEHSLRSCTAGETHLMVRH